MRFLNRLHLKRKLSVSLVALSGGLIFLFQNMTFPTGAATGCGTPGQLNIAGGVPQFCDGAELVSMKGASRGGCGTANTLSANAGDMLFCDGATLWSIVGPGLGACSVNQSISWNGSVPTICLGGNLYSSNTPTTMITSAFQASIGRAPSAAEVASILVLFNLSLVSSSDISSAIQAAVSQNPSLASSTSSTWSYSGNGIYGSATACGGGEALSGNSCVARVCSPNTVQSCGGGMQTCNADGSAWGACGAPGTVTSQVATDNYVFVRSVRGQAFYNYAPDVIYYNGMYHMYVCGGTGGVGDYILHSQSVNPWGPFHASNNNANFSYDVSLQPTVNSANFDGYETCDPSVMLSNGTWYLYYGGLGTQSNSTSAGAIGVATSSDGIHFARANGGRAIVGPVNWTPNINAYGAGQPAMFYIAPYYYMSFTDTTAPGGAGQYMMRSTDPIFQSGIQELVGPGTWVDRGVYQRTGQYAWMGAFSIDLALDTQTGYLFVTSDGATSNSTQIYVMNPTTMVNYGSISVGGTWDDGSSFPKNPDRTMLSRPSCNSIDFNVYKGDSSTGQNSATYVLTWDISRSEAIVNLAAGLCP